MHRQYANGNRVAVPKSLNLPHFLYHVDASIPVRFESFVDAANEQIRKNPLGCSQIDAFTAGLTDNLKSEVSQISASLGLDAEEVESAQIIVCEWASVHDDYAFAGKCFLSVIMHTGPQPYVMQMAHTEVGKGAFGEKSLSVVTSTRQLNVGDIILFDPTTPHMAAPKRPADGQLLVLLQFELADPDQKSRNKLIKRFPPKTNVISGDNVFSDRTSDPVE